MTVVDRLRPYRPVLWAVALVGLVGLNGVFLYFAVAEPGLVVEALRNPVSAVFVLEAFVMMGFAAWVIRLARPGRPGWTGFVVLSLVGGLAFSVPAYLLLRMREMRETRPEGQAG